MFKKIVKFEDGTYGVRKWYFWHGYLFLDMEDFGYWWWYRDNQIEHCRGTLEQAKKGLSIWKNINGKSVKL